MATKEVLISFEFEDLGDEIKHDPGLEHNFARGMPGLTEGKQPVVAEAFARIQKCLNDGLDTMFGLSVHQVQNLSNFIHVATYTFDTYLQHIDGSEAQCGMIALAKFYRLYPTDVYRVSLDVEQMMSSLMPPDCEFAYDKGMPQEKVDKLVELLDKHFKLDGRIEVLPVINRGRGTCLEQ